MAKRVGIVSIAPDHCKGCGLCVEACPTQSLRLTAELNRLGYHPAQFLVDTGCSGCGICFQSCPEPSAITVFHEG